MRTRLVEDAPKSRRLGTVGLAAVATAMMGPHEVELTSGQRITLPGHRERPFPGDCKYPANSEVARELIRKAQEKRIRKGRPA